jgi:hypothetical protein
METAVVIMLLVIGAVGGGLVVAAWNSDSESQPAGPDNIETRARSLQ